MTRALKLLLRLWVALTQLSKMTAIIIENNNMPNNHSAYALFNHHHDYIATAAIKVIPPSAIKTEADALKLTSAVQKKLEAKGVAEAFDTAVRDALFSTIAERSGLSGSAD